MRKIIWGLILSVLFLSGCYNSHLSNRTYTSNAKKSSVIPLKIRLAKSLQQKLNTGNMTNLLNKEEKELNLSVAKKVLANKHNNQIFGWKNQATGASGDFVVTNSKTLNGKFCRYYINIIRMNDTEARNSGLACKKKVDNGYIWDLP